MENKEKDFYENLFGTVKTTDSGSDTSFDEKEGNLFDMNAGKLLSESATEKKKSGNREYIDRAAGAGNTGTDGNADRSADCEDEWCGG